MANKLSELAAAAEKATDEFVVAVDARTEAEAVYLRAYHTASARSDAATDAARKREAEAAALEELIAFKAADGALERAKAVLRTRLAILSAAQTHYRAVERQT